LIRQIADGERPGDVTGEVSLHGVTHPIVLRIVLLEHTKNPGGVEITRWTARSENLSRRAFGLIFSRGREAIFGIGDQITLKIECVATAVD